MPGISRRLPEAMCLHPTRRKRRCKMLFILFLIVMSAFLLAGSHLAGLL